MNNATDNLFKIKKLRKKSHSGFTLLEVMLAIAVFAIAGVAILGVADTSTRNLGYLERKIIANWVASNQLVEASLATKWPPKNNQKGKVELAGIEWFWQQKVLETTDKNMRAIRIDVRINEKSESPLTSLLTYVAKSD